MAGAGAAASRAIGEAILLRHGGTKRRSRISSSCRGRHTDNCVVDSNPRSNTRGGGGGCRSEGYTRYAFRVQYHGGSFLGFNAQRFEDRVDDNGVDLRGYTGVETRLWRAFRRLLPSSIDENGDDDDDAQHRPRRPKFENLQVSSRTDRGVHALGNTFHVDVADDAGMTASNLHHGLNYHLARDNIMSSNSSIDSKTPIRRLKGATLYRDPSCISSSWIRYSPFHDVRILAVRKAPDKMRSRSDRDGDDEIDVDWNARFSATQRTYMYRILHGGNDITDWSAPFEWDRSWRVALPASKGPPSSSSLLDVQAMQRASQYLVGEHDFSSFRSKGCERSSPVVNLQSVQVRSQPFRYFGGGIDDDYPKSVAAAATAFWGDEENNDDDYSACDRGSGGCELLTIAFRGNAFLYRQVRNMTGCLVHVGRGKLEPERIPDLLRLKDRRAAPSMAPAHGLFLVDVRHGDFVL